MPSVSYRMSPRLNGAWPGRPQGVSPPGHCRLGGTPASAVGVLLSLPAAASPTTPASGFLKHSGGSVGLMGSLAQAARAHGSSVVGIIPESLMTHELMGEKIGEMEEVEILAPFAGMVRGLIHMGVNVTRGMKIGDIDPRNNPAACYLVSDKALAVGGGVLEALLGVPDIRNKLWN